MPPAPPRSPAPGPSCSPGNAARRIRPFAGLPRCPRPIAESPPAMPDDAAPLDCLIIGGGPAGLTAAIYLARFRRRVLVVDSGTPRAAWIPTSHNIPFFAEGIAGPDILRRDRETAARYGVQVEPGTVAILGCDAAGFAAATR